MGKPALLPCVLAVVAAMATNACQPNADEPSATDYCEVAHQADERINAVLADFNPETATPAELEQIFKVAVAESAATSEAAPAEIATELRLMKDRWSAQQETFADVGYVFADAPAEVMELVGESRDAFEKIAQYNSDQCGLDHDHDHGDHEHAETTDIASP